MKEKIQHEKLGECKVLLETTLNNGKCFKLIETYGVKKIKTTWSRRNWWTSEEKWRDAREDGRAKRPHYYAMWGMSHEPERMGVTKLTTKGGNNPAKNKVTNYFLELVDASDKMEFKH
jgi:hypothetical protein